MNEDKSDVIPPNELERRRRVLSCTEDLSDVVKDATERIRELHDLGVPAAEWLSIIGEQSPPIVLALISRYGGLIGSVVDGFIAARVAGATNGRDGVMAAMADVVSRGGPFVDVQPPSDVELATPSGRRMQKVIMRLFDEAPKLTEDNGQPREGQAPALECHIMLKAGGQIAGALSTTPEGTLRMLCLMPSQRGGDPVMIEHFFDFEQIADIAVQRAVTATSPESPRIIT